LIGERVNRRRMMELLNIWRRKALMIAAAAIMALAAGAALLRGYVNPDDPLSGYFISTGFTFWLVGVTALFSCYAPVCGRPAKHAQGAL
jgi:hypothetical protein